MHLPVSRPVTPISLRRRSSVALTLCILGFLAEKLLHSRELQARLPGPSGHVRPLTGSALYPAPEPAAPCQLCRAAPGAGPRRNAPTGGIRSQPPGMRSCRDARKVFIPAPQSLRHPVQFPNRAADLRPHPDETPPTPRAGAIALKVVDAALPWTGPRDRSPSRIRHGASAGPTFPLLIFRKAPAQGPQQRQALRPRSDGRCRCSAPGWVRCVRVAYVNGFSQCG